MRIEPLGSHRHLIAEIAGLLNQEWGELAPWASAPAIERRLAGQTEVGRAPFTLVALGDGGAFLGTASVKLFELPEHPDKAHWLGEVYVRSGLRRQGVGAALIRACITASRTLRLPALDLYTPDQQAFYARLGWKELAGAPVNGEHVSIMRLRLKHAAA